MDDVWQRCELVESRERVVTRADTVICDTVWTRRTRDTEGSGGKGPNSAAMQRRRATLEHTNGKQNGNTPEMRREMKDTRTHKKREPSEKTL